MKKVALCAASALLFAGASADDVVVVEETVAAQTNCFDSVYGGLGIGGNFLKSRDERFNRFSGNVAFGAGKVFNSRYYVGAEFMMDYAKSRKKSIDGKEVKVNGVVPQLSARFGYVFNDANLAYLKAGANKSRISISGKNSSKIAPVVGLGYERCFCKKFSTAVEGEYAFGFKPENETKRVNKGWTVRAFVKYNVKY